MWKSYIIYCIVYFGHVAMFDMHTLRAGLIRTAIDAWYLTHPTMQCV